MKAKVADSPKKQLRTTEDAATPSDLCALLMQLEFFSGGLVGPAAGLELS